MGSGHASGTVNRLAENWAEAPPTEAPSTEAHPTPPSSQKAVASNCPGCQQPLWVVTGARWCSRCGYRQLNNEVPTPTPAPEGASAVWNAEEWSKMALWVPRWAWVMVGGLLAVVLGSLDAGLLLPPDCWQRAAWTTAQVVTGLVGLVLAQVSVCSLLGLQRYAPGMWDLVVPERVWRLAVRRLPETHGQVCCAAWCAALVVGGLFLVGGLTYWLPKKGETKPRVYVAKLMDLKKEQTEAEAGPAAGAGPAAQAPPSSGTTLQPPENEPAPKPETARCVVVGYTVEDGEVTGLVVARQEGDELRYAGTVRPELSAEQKESLLKRFAALASKRPVFADFEKPVVWLKPELSCEVEHTGTGESPLLKEPRFKGLVEDEKPGPDGAAAPDGQPPTGAQVKPGEGPKAPAPAAPAKPKPDQAAPGRR